MPHDRFYSSTALSEEGIIPLVDEELHHLSRVMRAQIGDIVECFDGKGVLAEAKVIELNKKEALLQVQSLNRVEKPQVHLSICQALVRATKLELILEKGIELGLHSFILFKADYSEKVNLSSNQEKRFHKIRINACKQSGQLWLPEIHLLDALNDFKMGSEMLFFGDTDKQAPLFEKVWKEAPPSEGATFFVGPEKGFSEREEKVLRDMGAKGVKLSDLILRTETAPIAAMSLMGHWTMIDQ